jgi:hypothetical protein
MKAEKYTFTVAEITEKVNEAVDSVLLPLLTELCTLGVSQETIGTAMMNIAERRLDEEEA